MAEAFKSRSDTNNLPERCVGRKCYILHYVMDSIAVVVSPHYQCLPTDLLIFSKLRKKRPLLVYACAAATGCCL